MPPGEHLDGTTAECAHLHLLLACFRASPPPMRLPGVTGRPLPDVLGTEVIDADVFHRGYAIMAARYEQLGIRALLPLERVWVGTRSAAGPGAARSHGGFHYPAQGYRHIQMDAAVTVFGDLTGTAPVSPQAAALDLVRSYAHDCLHYATFRRYRLTAGARSPASSTASTSASRTGAPTPPPTPPAAAPPATWASSWRGPPTPRPLPSPGRPRSPAGSPARTLRRACPAWFSPTSRAPSPPTASRRRSCWTTLTPDPLGRFGNTVTLRYRALLSELDASPADAHSQIVAAMISGDLAPLEAWLDARHGPGSFARMFRAPLSGAEPGPVR
jgi:hypothetical protein